MKVIIKTALVFTLLIQSIVGLDFISVLQDLEFYKDLSDNSTYYFKNGPKVCSDPLGVLCRVGPDGKASILNGGLIANVTTKNESTGHHILIYAEGSTCETADGGSETADGRKKRFKTRFDIFCPSSDEKIVKPLMLSSSDSCFLNFFAWHRSKDCPETQTRGCLLQLPEYEQWLDLTVLKTDTYYQAASQSKDEVFQFNICGHVQGSDRCTDQAVVCQMNGKNSSEIIGLDSEITTALENEVVIITYAHKDVTVKYKLICNADSPKDPVMTYKGQTNDTNNNIKEYIFEVKTPNVCLTPPQPCIKDDIDLTPLRQVYHPWKAYGNGLEFQMTVCKSLSPTTSCPPGSGLCALKPGNGSNETISFGTIQGSTMMVKEDTLDKGEPVLVYNYGAGSICNDKVNYSSQIIFQCHPVELGPKIFDHFDHCSYIFLWKTPQACPQKEFDSKTCIVKDDFFGHNFDLSEIHGAVDHTIDEEIKINPCGGLKDNKKVSISIQDHIIGWSSTEKLTYADGSLKLSYQGEPCTQNDVTSGEVYRATISFHCDQEIGQGLPKMAFKEGCHYQFVWSSTLACPPFDEVACSAADENSEIFDFSPLTLSDSQYRVPVGTNGVVGINLCRSLVFGGDFGCPYKSAACLRTSLSNGSVTFTNLGQVDSKGPYLDEYHRLVMDYSNGGPCRQPGSSANHISTKIIFK